MVVNENKRLDITIYMCIYIDKHTCTCTLANYMTSLINWADETAFRRTVDKARKRLVLLFNYSRMVRRTGSSNTYCNRREATQNSMFGHCEERLTTVYLRSLNLKTSDLNARFCRISNFECQGLNDLPTLFEKRCGGKAPLRPQCVLKSWTKCHDSSTLQATLVPDVCWHGLLGTNTFDRLYIAIGTETLS